MAVTSTPTSTTNTLSSSNALAGSGTLSSAGIGSGLDVNGIVSKLMAIERAPIDRIDTQTTGVQAEITAYGTLKGSLSSLQTAVQTLTNKTTFSATKTTVADTTQLSATSDGTAAPGNYSVQVNHLALAEKIQSAGFNSATDSIGSGTLTFDFGTYNTSGGVTSFALNTNKKTVSVTIPSGASSLNSIADAINAAKAGVSATVLNDGTKSYLSFSPLDPGSANSLRIGVSDADGNNSDAVGLSRLAFDKTTGDLTGSVGFAAPNLVTISAASNNNQLKIALDGGAATTVTIPDGKYDAVNIVATLQTAVDSALGSGKATVALNGSNQLVVSSNTTPSANASLAPGNSGQTALFGVNLAAPHAVAVSAALSNNQFDLSIDGGSSQTLTLPDGSYDASNIVSTVQGLVDTAFGSGAATVSLDGSNQLVINSNTPVTGTAVASATTGNTGQSALFGVNLSTSVAVAAASSNNRFMLALDGGTAQAVTLPDGSYNSGNIVAAIQTAVNTAFGSGKATVSLNGSNHLVITSTTSPSANLSAVSGNSGLTALSGVSLTAPNAVSISAASSNNKFKVAVDGGTATQVTIPDGTYDAANIVAAVQASINTALGAGKATVSLNASNQLVIASAATSGLASVALTEVASNSGLSTLFGSTGTSVSSSTRMTESVAPQDAELVIDGVTVKKSTNTITDAIRGVTLSLTKESTTATTISVTSDNSALSSGIDAFVKAYNTTSAMLKDLLSYDPTTGTSGALQSEGTVRSIQAELSSTLQTLSRGTGLNGLSDLGVSFQRDGTLAFNSDKLNTALSDPTKNVKALFIGTDPNGTTDGIANKLNNLLDTFLQSDGTLTARTDGLNQEISDYAKQKADLETRMTAIEARYRKQYSDLDTLIASMNQTSSYLTQQLANLPGMVSTTSK